jgi:hypothetical protein
VEGEAAEAAGGDGEAAQVAEPQRGRRGAQLQDASPQLVGEIRRRHAGSRWVSMGFGGGGFDSTSDAPTPRRPAARERGMRLCRATRG